MVDAKITEHVDNMVIAKLRDINAHMATETAAEQIAEIELQGNFPIKTVGSLLVGVILILCVWGIIVKREHWREDEIDRI